MFDAMFDDEDRAFFNAMASEDDIGLILRIHLHCARILERMINKANVANPSHFKAANLKFQPIVHVLSALGEIDANTRDRMIWLDKLRNELAHPASKDRLGKKDLERMQAALGEAGRIVVAQVNAYETEPTPGRLIRNALYIIRNNLKYVAINGIAKYKEVDEGRLATYERSKTRSEL
jgi:hypothetical protein